VKANFEVKKAKAPSKNPLKCPIICFAPDKKNNLLDFQNQRYIGIFISLRERERGEGEREREQEGERDKSERERNRNRKRKWKRKKKRVR
jgi:hypothetical protein